MTHVNSGRKIMWKLWRTWPGAQEIDQRNEIINWMAASLMHQIKKTDFNSVLLDKLNTNWLGMLTMMMILILMLKMMTDVVLMTMEMRMKPQWMMEMRMKPQ